MSEGENGFITFTVEGDPAPTVEWFKGFKDLSVEGRSVEFNISHHFCAITNGAEYLFARKIYQTEFRYKFWTNGEENTITLGCHESRADDEGDYRAVLRNDNGEVEYGFKFYVTVEGGMDFRAMLMKRKVKQKKIVVKTIEWLEVTNLI